MSLPSTLDPPAVDPPATFLEIDNPPEALLTEDTFINGQPCPPGPIPACPYPAEPVKLRPAMHVLHAVTPTGGPEARLVTAKRIALPAKSITAVPVRLLGQHAKAAIHLAAPEQRIGEDLVIPEGLYSRPGTTHVLRVLVVNKGEQPLLLDAGLPVTGKLVKPDRQLHAMEAHGEPPDMQQLWADLKLEDNEFLQCDPFLKKEVWTFISEFRDVFFNSTPGCTDLVELELRPKPGTQSIRQRFKDLNPRQEAELEAQLETWLQEGVIEPSSSAWSSPLVPIKKKDGSTRWAVDYRALNKCLVLDSYPLPRIQQLVEWAGGHRVYSALDAVSIYYTIRIEPDRCPCPAFSTPKGLYQWKRMPFSLATAPSGYSRFIEGVLNPLGTANLQSYLDDILTFHQKESFACQPCSSSPPITAAEPSQQSSASARTERRG